MECSGGQTNDIMSTFKVPLKNCVFFCGCWGGGLLAKQCHSFVKLFLFLSYLVCLLEFIVSGCDTWWIFIIPTLSPASFLRRLPLNSLSLPHHHHHHPSPSPPPLPHPHYVMMTRLMISKVIAEWDKVWSRLSSHLQPFFFGS